MTLRTFAMLPRSFAATAVLALVALSPSLSHAQSACEVTSDCDQGFECTVVGGSGCAPSATPTCPPGMECPIPEPQPCVVVEEKACTPAHCTSDAQCADGMVCHAWEMPCAVTDCACSSDMPDCNCGAVPACEPETVSYCTPRYVLPCTQAADCGEGFTCQQAPAECSCGGSAEARPSDPAAGGSSAGAPLPPSGSGGGSADFAPPADPLPDPDCTCTPSSVLVCVAQEIECASASECPDGWICEQEPQPGVPACVGDGCPTIEPLPAARSLCRPQYYSGGSSVGYDANGEAEGTPAPTKGGTGTNNPQTPNSSTEGAEAHESAACQMGHAPASSSALAWLAVLGALLGLKRRRA